MEKRNGFLEHTANGVTGRERETERREYKRIALRQEKQKQKKMASETKILKRETDKKKREKKVISVSVLERERETEQREFILSSLLTTPPSSYYCLRSHQRELINNRRLCFKSP